LDIKRLTRGEQILGVAALLLFLSSFLAMWASVDFGVDVPGFSTDLNAWDAYNFFPLKLGLIIALVAVVWVALRAANVNMNLPWPAGLVALILGGATLLLVLLSLLTGPVLNIDRGILLYVGIVLAAAMAYGGYLAWQADQAGPTTYGGPAAPPPGPPPPA
jgi:hypothetical protein